MTKNPYLSVEEYVKLPLNEAMQYGPEDEARMGGVQFAEQLSRFKGVRSARVLTDQPGSRDETGPFSVAIDVETDDPQQREAVSEHVRERMDRICWAHRVQHIDQPDGTYAARYTIEPTISR
jgi:hypothetical protein